DRQPDTARIVVRFGSVHCYAVAPPIAAVKREATLGCLLNSEIRIRSRSRGIRDAGRQQSECEKGASLDGEIVEEFMGDRIGLACPLRVHRRWFCINLNRLRCG